MSKITDLKERLERTKDYPPIPTVLTHQEADFLSEVAKGKVVLDIGSGQGFGLTFLARTAIHVHAVDWHLGDRKHTDGALAISPMGGSLGSMFMHLELNNLLPKVTAHVGTTQEILPLWRGGLFDLVVVDGDEFNRHRHWDLVQAYRLAKYPAGVIVTRIQNAELQEAVRVFCEVDPGLPAGWNQGVRVGDLVLLDRQTPRRW